MRVIYMPANMAYCVVLGDVPIVFSTQECFFPRLKDLVGCLKYHGLGLLKNGAVVKVA